MRNEKLLSVCELAFEMGRSVRYVYAMRANGFLMPGGRATVSEARAWLVRNPPPTSRRFRKVQERAAFTCCD